MQKRVVEPQADETRTESQVARAEPSRGAPSWSKMMAEVQPCGHTNAQHLYHDSGDIKIDLSACVASRGAPDAAQEFARTGDWPVYRWPDGSAVFRFAEAYAKSRHVVLLEALRSTIQSLDDWLCDDTISDETQSEMLTLEDEILKLLRKFEAEAAIQQAERP